MTRSHYYFKDDEFVIEDYDRQKPFASFLPSLSGTWGIPLWAYYTNRGQGIAGFGVENKDGAIMDFVPANVSYARTELQGFRTFIKIDNHVSELFSSVSEDQVHRRMRIAYNALSFEEVNKTLGIRAVVRYQTTTNQPYPGLVRTLDLYNLSGHPKSVEVLDGLATIWPYRNDDSVIKAMTNLAVAWFDVSHTSRGVPFYKNRSTTHDSAAIGTVESGHFYAAFALEDKRVLPVIYDPDIIFGTHTSQLKPVNFIKRPLEDLLKIKQVCENKKLCAFSAYTFDLEDAISLGAVIGKATDMAQLEEITESLCPAFFKEQRREALELTERLLEDVACETAYPIFDAYVKQCYLDNFLRGGYPLLFEGAKEPIIYHVYSRIHGDMEREYNNFYLEPTYFSHGNGNFRDVNQNRRNDVYFVKEAGLFNLRMFVDLIQLDGHNPLTVKGSKFRVEKKDRNRIMKAVLTGQRRVSGLLEGDFSPGALMMAIDHKDISLGISKDEFLKLVLRHALQENHAAFGHGYWVDHWTYNMDLVESYLNIFPEALEGLMFEEVFKYFRSGYKVLPRHKKYVKTGDGKIRQYDALVCDDEKLEAENFDAAATNWHRYKNGQVVSTSLATKLLVLAVQKITDLDPSGLGIMMNSDKPGWNDAMNGLPGLFGSSISEVVELKRMIDFLRTHLSQFKRDLQMPVEVLDFIASYGQMLALRLTSDTYTNELHYWESVQTLKEAFLVTIDGPLSGDAGVFDDAALMGLLEGMNRKVNDALERAGSYGEGILPSYFIHEAVRYSEIPGQTNLVNGLQCVAVHEWSCRVLPLFLEAPARYLKQLQCVDEARSMYLRIKDSQLYDKGLKMYVTSESLEAESYEIGRARAFTPGWLERESVFMHMSYKYLLGVLKSGNAEGFYEAIRTALPPFMDPATYGRSTLENASFIASSRNPDPQNHGRGFVSRLTGTTSEFISMWLHMMTGSKVFTFKNELHFELAPVLSGDFFDERAEVRFNFLKQTTIVYRNPSRLNTYGPNAVRPKAYELHYKHGTCETRQVVVGNAAEAVRRGEVKTIYVSLA